MMSFEIPKSKLKQNVTQLQKQDTDEVLDQNDGRVPVFTTRFKLQTAAMNHKVRTDRICP